LGTESSAAYNGDSTQARKSSRAVIPSVCSRSSPSRSRDPSLQQCDGPSGSKPGIMFQVASYGGAGGGLRQR
jgi:hypothetical protein